MADQKIKQLSQKAADAQKAYKSFWDEHDGDKDLTPEQKQTLKDLGRTADEAIAELTEYKSNYERAGKAEQFLKEFRNPANPLANGEGVKGGAQPQRRKSLGEIFTSDANVLEALKSGDIARMKTLITADSGSAGDLLESDRTGIFETGENRRPLTIRQLVTVLQTNADSVEWVQETTATNGATMLGNADSTDSADNTGRIQESTLVFDGKTTSIKWVATGIPVTEQMLQDVPQLRTYIDNFLRYAIDEKLEDQMITGDGLGDNLTGLLTHVDVQAQAYSNSMIETLRKAKTKARKIGKVTDLSAIITPENWETLELSLDAEDRYLLGGPIGVMTPTMWGMRIAESEALSANKAIVGAFRYAILWDRMVTELSVHPDHKDFAEKNMLYLRARARHGFGLQRPKAFVETNMA